MLNRVLAGMVILLIQAYRSTLGALLPRSCRFHPSCSQYALEAVKLHGPGRGTIMAVKRVLRCHPLNPGGFDPVPDPKPPHNTTK